MIYVRKTGKIMFYANCPRRMEIKNRNNRTNKTYIILKCNFFFSEINELKLAARKEKNRKDGRINKKKKKKNQ